MSYTQAWLESREPKTLEAAREALLVARALLWDVLAEVNALDIVNHTAEWPESLPEVLRNANACYAKREEEHTEEVNRLIDERDECAAARDLLQVELTEEKRAREAAENAAKSASVAPAVKRGRR